jgi:hypothetical protein
MACARGVGVVRVLGIASMRVVASGLLGLALVTGCGSGGESKRAIMNTIVLTRDDGYEIAVEGPVSVTCGPANGDGAPALLVRVGRRTPGAPQAFWQVQVGLANLKRDHKFRFPEKNGAGDAFFFAFDAGSGQNELSSSAEEAGGQIPSSASVNSRP